MFDGEQNLKIIDFGLSLDVTELKQKANFLEQTEQSKFKLNFAGTKGYMAPEIATENYNPVKADVFSFGLIVLEMAIMEKIKEESDEAFFRKISHNIRKLDKIYEKEQLDKSQQKNSRT